MKILKKIWIMSVLCMGNASAQEQDCSRDSEIIQISAETLKQDMEGGCGAFVINVLNKNTFKDCSIPGSIHVSAHQLAEYAKKKLQKVAGRQINQLLFIVRVESVR